MASKNSQILNRSFENKRTFAYNKGNVNLSFTLNIDTKSELKDFLELLKTAAEDVAKVLETFK